jgi:flagellar hook-associated protein 1
MGLNGLLGLARDALAAQSFALDVTGQNVANVNTPGYVRRSAVLETRVMGTVTTGGVQTAGIQRAVDQFLDGRVYDATGQASSARTHDQELGSIEALFNDTNGTGLGSTISALFGSFAALSANPSDPTTRANVLQRADDFASRLRDTVSQVQTLRQNELSQAKDVASQATDLASQIAKLNEKIKVSEAAGGDASDLRDQQGKLVGQLSAFVDVSTFTDGQGQLVVRAAGTTLIEGNTAASLSVTTDTSGSMRLLVQRSTGSPIDVTDHLTAGTLAGLKEARDTDAPAVLAKLDELASDVGGAINAQHMVGYGTDGGTGRALFSGTGSAATIALDAGMVGHPEYVAASATAAGLPGASDNATALAKLSTSRIASGGTTTAADAYAAIVGDVGLRKSASAQENSLRDSMKAQAESMQSSQEGVSMDEEMVNLTKYQRAYQAASRLVTTADQLMQELLSMVGR